MQRSGKEPLNMFDMQYSYKCESCLISPIHVLFTMTESSQPSPSPFHHCFLHMESNIRGDVPAHIHTLHMRKYKNVPGFLLMHRSYTQKGTSCLQKCCFPCGRRDNAHPYKCGDGVCASNAWTELSGRMPDHESLGFLSSGRVWINVVGFTNMSVTHLGLSPQLQSWCPNRALATNGSRSVLANIYILT